MPQDANLPDPSSPPEPRDARRIAGRIDGPHSQARPPALPPPTGLAAAPDFMSLLVALRHRWISAVLLGGTLGLITAAAVWFLLTPKNTSFAQLRVLYIDPKVFGDTTTGPVDFKTTLQTTAHEVTGQNVIREALKRDEVKKLHLERTEPDPVQAVSEDLRAEFKENSELLTILYTHPDPAVATTVLGAIKTVYLTEIVEEKKRVRTNKVAKLQAAYDNALGGLNLKRASLRKAEKDRGGDPAFWRDQRLQLTLDLRDAKAAKAQNGARMIEARWQLDVCEARLNKRSRPDPKAPATAAEKGEREAALAAFLDSDMRYRDLENDLDSLKARVKRLAEQYHDTYRPLIDLRERKKTTQDLLDRRRAALTRRFEKAPRSPSGTPAGTVDTADLAIARDQYQKQVAALKKLDDSMAEAIAEIRKKLIEEPALAAEYEQSRDEIEREEKNVNTLGMQLSREKIELQAASRISLHQDPALMKKDVKKQILATAVSPLAVFFAVSFGLAFFEFRKRRVRRASEVSGGLGIRVVGAIPRSPHLQRQLVAAGESDLDGTPVMESIDAIRTRLLHEANTRATRVVMVTSAGPGEGKTTLAAALATSLARAGRKTLLLDGDLRRPTLHELFEVPVQPGFSEVLLGEIEVSEAAQEAHPENLSILPAGQWDREVLLALSRDGLEGVFERLGEEFDFILVDSHPVLSATDSLLIGRHVDAVILSVLREVSQMPRIYAAQQQLAGLGIRVLGAVVNGTDPEEVFSAPAPAAAVA